MSESSSSSSSDSDELWVFEQQYRYGGFRYSLRGPAKYGPDEIVPQLPSLYPYPITDTDQPAVRYEKNIEEQPQERKIKPDWYYMNKGC